MDVRVSRTRGAALLCCGICLAGLFEWTGQGRAQSGERPDFRALPTGEDYDSLNSDWNGLSELRRMLVGVGRSVSIDEPIDLSQLSIETPIALIYPRSSLADGTLPVEDLLAFVREGGRLLLADDFGDSRLLMEAIGVFPLLGPLPHSSFYQRNPQLPVFWVQSDAELVEDVIRVVANHPVILASERPAVLAYDDSDFGLLYDIPLGRGRVIVLGDPSLTINFMLDVADNRTLVLNLFRALCQGLEPCRLYLLAGDIRFSGRYPAHVQPESQLPVGLTERFSQSIQNVNTLLEGVTHYRPSPQGVFIAALVLALGTAVLLFSLLPLSRPRWLGFSFRQSEDVRCRSEYEWNLEQYAKHPSQADYALPLAILKEQFEELFYAELARHPGELESSEQSDEERMTQFAQRFAERVVANGSGRKRRAVANRTLRTLRALSRIPSREILVPEIRRRYSERRFRRLFGQTREMLRELGIWEQYERRISRPTTN